MIPVFRSVSKFRHLKYDQYWFESTDNDIIPITENRSYPILPLLQSSALLSDMWAQSTSVNSNTVQLDTDLDMIIVQQLKKKCILANTLFSIHLIREDCDWPIGACCELWLLKYWQTCSSGPVYWLILHTHLYVLP